MWTKLRLVPVERLSDVGAAPARAAGRNSDAALPIRLTAVGIRRSERMRPRAASMASCPRDGPARGNPVLTISGAPSTRLANTANPPIPSASTWWNTRTRAASPGAVSVTRVAAQSGRFRGILAPISSAARPSTVSSPWGAAQRREVTWLAISNAGSSTHTGRFQQPCWSHFCRAGRYPNGSGPRDYDRERERILTPNGLSSMCDGTDRDRAPLPSTTTKHTAALTRPPAFREHHS